MRTVDAEIIKLIGKERLWRIDSKCGRSFKLRRYFVNRVECIIQVPERQKTNNNTAKKLENTTRKESNIPNNRSRNPQKQQYHKLNTEGGKPAGVPLGINVITENIKNLEQWRV